MSDGELVVRDRDGNVIRVGMTTDEIAFARRMGLKSKILGPTF